MVGLICTYPVLSVYPSDFGPGCEAGAFLLAHWPPQLAASFIFLYQSRDVAYWHFADKLTATAFVAYWTNNGQKAALGPDLSAAIDP